MTISLDIPKSENIRSTLVVILREFSSIDQKEEYKSRIQQCVASVRGKLAQEVRDVVYAELKHKEKSHDTGKFDNICVILPAKLSLIQKI